MPSARAVDPDERATDRIDEARVDSELRIIETAPAARNIACLPIQANPAIFSLILSHSSVPTLATLLRCSHATFQLASQVMYRNLRMICDQFAAMIEVGSSSSGSAGRSGATRGMLARSYSVSLKHRLDLVHSLHLINYTPNSFIPILVPGSFAAIKSIVIEFDPTWIPSDQCQQHILPPAIRDIGASHLYIWVPGSWVAIHDSVTRGNFCVIVGGLGRGFQSISLLLPFAYSLDSHPLCGLSTLADAMDRHITVVLLPWQQSRYTAIHNARMCKKWSDHVSSCRGHQAESQEFVGAEYIGRPLGDGNLFFPTSQYHSGVGTDLTMCPRQRRGPKLSRSFSDWLEEQVPGCPFTSEEMETFKRMDKDLTREVALAHEG